MKRMERDRRNENWSSEEEAETIEAATLIDIHNWMS